MKQPKRNCSIRKKKKFLKKIILNPADRERTVRGFLRKGNTTAATLLCSNPDEFYRRAITKIKH